MLNYNKTSNLKNSEIIEGIVFYSDSNIVEKLIEFKDENKLYLISYNNGKNNADNISSRLLFAQIISGSLKTHSSYTFYDKECLIFDKDINLVGTRDLELCEKILDSNHYIIELRDTTGKETFAIITNNKITLFAKDSDKNINQLRLLLRVLFPNLDEIESRISRYINNINASGSNNNLVK